MTYELSLFTGAGGGLLGTHLLGWKPCGYVEFNDYCQRVIAARIRDGYLPVAPIFSDVREFVESGAAEQYRGIADVVSAGFPCQPFSVAGKQRGANDERNMWPATRDVVRLVQPESVFLENVRGLISSGYLATVIGDLADLGYVGRWGVISAADCGAPHKRERLWIVAHASCGKDRRVQQPRLEPNAIAGCSLLADANSVRPSGSWWAIDPGSHPSQGNREEHRAFDGSRWGIESPLGRVAHGVAYRVDRLKALGNGQVPAVVERAYRMLSGDLIA